MKILENTEHSVISNCTEFQWDKGNEVKNWQKHNVTKEECEQIFFNRPLLLADDFKHSQGEKRYYVLGQTDNQRKLFIAFTIRRQMIRVISARPMSKKEEKWYEQEEINTGI